MSFVTIRQELHKEGYMDSQQPNINPQYTAPGNGGQQPQPQFNPVQPQPQPGGPNKKGLLIGLAVLVVIVVIAVVVTMAMSSKKDDTKTASNSSASNSSSSQSTSGDTSSSKFKKYEVTNEAGDAKYSVSFYQGGMPTAKSGLTYLLAGDAGSQKSFTLQPVTSESTDCKTNGLSATSMKISGKDTPVCYKADRTGYVAATAVKGIAYKVAITGQQAISQDDAKTILESFTLE
jgi:hypothetical protein